MLEEPLAEDLINLLVRPDAQMQTQPRPWFLLPFVPLNIIGGWMKHLLWLSARSFPFTYPKVAANTVIKSEAVQKAIENLSKEVSKLLLISLLPLSLMKCYFLQIG